MPYHALSRLFSFQLSPQLSTRADGRDCMAALLRASRECGAAASLWRGESRDRTRRNRRRATCNTYVLRCNGRLWRPAGAGRRPAGHRRRPSPMAHAAEEVCQLEVTGAHEMHPLHRHLTCHCLDLTCFYVWGNGLQVQRGSEPQSSGARCPGDARKHTRTVPFFEVGL